MLWMVVGSAAVVVLILLAVVVVRRRRRRSELISIVMLRPTPRRLTEADVRGAARRAHGSDIEVMRVPSPDPGTTECFVVLRNGAPGFFVIDAGRAYTDDPQGDSGGFEDPRAREAFAAHRAWVAVDVAGGLPPAEFREQVARLQGRLAAELLDDHCTLLYAPSRRRIALPGPETEAALRGDDPYSIFSDDEANTPIIRTEADDGAIERAMERARREWPEFVAAWERLGKESRGLAKGRFTTDSGGNEYIWLEVTAAAEDGVVGEVANRPADVPGLSKGQSVTIPLADIVDWGYVENEKPRGMFVEKLLHRRMAGK